MASNKKERYPEKALQLAATEWLSRKWGYVEVFADENAQGARVDSIGLLDGRLLLIEVKTSVSSAIVDHLADRSHSIESKIAGALGPLYRGELTPVAEAGNRIWDRKRSPLVCMLAQSFPGLDSLTTMLTRRSGEWHFDWAVFHWTGEAIDILAAAVSPPASAPVTYEAISVPQLIGRTPRAKARSIAELQTIAEEHGVGDLVRHFVVAAPTFGYAVHTSRWTIALKRKVEGFDHPQMIIGAYLDASSSGDLTIGCWREIIQINEDDLPGAPATRSPGYMNTNRVLRTTCEIDMLLKLFAPSHIQRG